MLPKLYNPDTGKFDLPTLPFEYGKNKGISKETDEFHHDKHFKSYTDGLNSFTEAMDGMRKTGDYSKVRGAMLGFSHNASGAYLHNIYYSILGGDGKMDENLRIVKKIKKDFGSVEAWLAEFKAVAMAARGWAVLGLFDCNCKLYHNMVDFHDQQIVYGIKPILVCDVWEHAYYHDQGPDRAKYVDAFLEALDWTKINGLYQVCMTCGCECCEDAKCDSCEHCKK